MLSISSKKRINKGKLSPTDRCDKLIKENPDEWTDLCRDYIRISKEFGHLAIKNEIKEKGENSLAYKIKKFGGFREVKKRIVSIIVNKSIENIEVPKNLKEWNNFSEEMNSVITELKNTKIIGESEFPTPQQIISAGRYDLKNAIHKYHGNWHNVKKLMGYEPKKKPPNYWKKWENIVNELQKVIDKDFNGVFPTSSQLNEVGHANLRGAIIRYGGFNEARRKLNHKILHQSSGYWKRWENVEKELRKAINEEFGGKFPEYNELAEKRSDLKYAISFHGGLIAARIAMGYDLDNWGEKSRYFVERGRKTEGVVKDILKEWAEMNGFSYKDKETQVGPSHFIEFVCGANRKYGIDITNSKTAKSVEHKWKRKSYHKYVDNLWVVVVTDKIRRKSKQYSRGSKGFSEQFKKWNNESPENVLVIDYQTLERTLNGITKGNIPFEIPPEKLQFLEALATCTFENKEETKRNFKKGRRVKILQRIL